MPAKRKRGIEIEFEGHDDGLLTLTLRGPATQVVGVLVNGLPVSELMKLAIEIDTVTTKRGARRAKKGK